jgi:micrococcal nuclease
VAYRCAQRSIWLLLAFLLLVPLPGLAHRGPLDSIGCHPSFSKLLGGGTAGYHCHWGPLAGRSFATREEALQAYTEASRPSGAPPEVNWQSVTRVIDNNSLVLEDGSQVRLLGVLPLQPAGSQEAEGRFAEAAKEVVQRLVEGKRVRLEFDPKVEESEGAAPAYLYLEGGVLLNSEVIRRGYGRADAGRDYRYKEQFAETEEEARKAGRGLWSEE